MQGLPNRSAEDDIAIGVLLQGIKGEGEKERQRGTFLTYLAAMQNDEQEGTDRFFLVVVPYSHNVDPVKLVGRTNSINLRKNGLYELVLTYLRQIWPEKQLVTDGGSQDGLIFYSTAVKSYATASVRNLKYGSSLLHGGKAYSYGFVDGRVAARIDYLLHISIIQSDDLPPLTTDIAIVRQFESAEHHVQGAPNPPPWCTWHVYSSI
jgi:hypothetical protein